MASATGSPIRASSSRRSRKRRPSPIGSTSGRVPPVRRRLAVAWSLSPPRLVRGPISGIGGSHAPHRRVHPGLPRDNGLALLRTPARQSHGGAIRAAAPGTRRRHRVLHPVEAVGRRIQQPLLCSLAAGRPRHPRDLSLGDGAARCGQPRGREHRSGAPPPVARLRAGGSRHAPHCGGGGAYRASPSIPLIPRLWARPRRWPWAAFQRATDTAWVGRTAWRQSVAGQPSAAIARLNPADRGHRAQPRGQRPHLRPTTQPGPCTRPLRRARGAGHS